MKKNIAGIVFFVLLYVGSMSAQAGDGFIFEPLSSGNALPGTQPDSHASTLVELPGGDVLSAWFAGTKEGAPDVAIYAARQHAGVWSVPVEVARTKDVACWNPVLFHDAKGVLWLYYKTGKSPSTWTGLRKHSEDEGRTWSTAEALPDGILGPIKDKPLVLPDGSIVSGSSVESGSWTVWIERSPDGGKTWTKIGPITVPEALDVPDAAALAAAKEGNFKPSDEPGKPGIKLYPPLDHMVGLIQPSVVSLGGHHLRFYARSHSRAQRIAVADSFDDGRTWTQARYIDLPIPNSGIDAVGLKDGRIVLVFNNSYNRRSPLSLAVSKDGEHFTVFKKLDEGPSQYSYPAIIQAANGDLLVTYSWQRRTIRFVRVPKEEIP
ncbi:sialidase family protein [Telmatobacter bradus]|uniref:sialidase family protein n=1 Tax=Telmatobacter bradus TaxID=474953 RepID=UPI003B42D5EC